jgi:hypothetical protein
MSSIKSASSLEIYGRSLRPNRTLLFSGSAGTVTCPSTGINISKRLQKKGIILLTCCIYRTKILLYKNLVCPILMYGWSAGHYPTQMRKMLDVLKRKMLQTTYSPNNNTDQ